jgi:thymidylate synthase
MKLSPIIQISETDFHNAWAKACWLVMEGKHLLVFGDEKKKAYDSVQMIEMTGHAIDQILRGETHPDYPFGGRRLEEYRKEFTREFLAEYLTRPEKDKFAYLYLERFVVPVDQIAAMFGCLARQVVTEVTSNQCQAITWRPDIDPGMKDCPCLQRISVRYVGNRSVDVRIEFRSRDVMAWQANVVAIVEMINREIVEPNGCKIVRVIDTSDSLHVYHYDWDLARTIRLVPVNPMER